MLKNAIPAVLLAAALATPVAASAQATDDWRFGAQLYAYLPTISGSSTFPAGGSTPSASVDVDQILRNLEFVFMGSFEARRGRWGAFTDLIYMDVGNDKSDTRDFTVGGIGIPASASANLRYDLKGLIWTLAGQYGAIAGPDGTLDVFAGARLVDLEQKINWDISGNLGSIPANGRSGGSDVSRSDWDGIVGVKGRLMLGAERRWFVPYYFDIGTGNSDLTWQAMAGIGYSWGAVDVVAAWRYLDYDLGAGKPFAELNLNGPSLAVGYRW